MTNTPDNTDMPDVLFSNDRLSPEECLKNPLIVVGLPRSGSSFLSHILSQIPDWYVFDDLYAHRRARQIKASDPMTAENLKEMVFFLGWQIRARLKFGTYAIPNLAIEEVPLLDAALTEAFTNKPGSWAEIQEEWMRRLAHRAGCTHWGYKMPGAFRFLPELREHYPDCRVLYVMRNPYKVLASFKHMPADSEDGDPRRYHPIAYAIYWRKAVRSYQNEKAIMGSRLDLVQFEDLVGRPEQTANRLAAFLETEAPKQIEIPPKPNSSFDGAKNKSGLTGLETWILNKIAGSEITALNYDHEPAKPRLSDLGDLAKTTMRFLGFYAEKVTTKLVPKRKN